MKIEQERERFEKWAKSCGYRIARCRDAPRDYTSGFLRLAWSAWRARARVSP